MLLKEFEEQEQKPKLVQFTRLATGHRKDTEL